MHESKFSVESEVRSQKSEVRSQKLKFNSEEIYLCKRYIAQKSFLRLEQTELRYRSRKQQEFYQYVADNLTDDIDREAFAQKVKQKQTEVLPQITTEEGLAAIDTYVKEINILSKYQLGLKLLALFKPICNFLAIDY